MKILHVVPGLNEPTNGIAVAAKLIAGEQSKSGAEVEVVETRDFMRLNIRTLEHCSEVWVHSMWLPQTVLACWKVLRSGKKLVRMPHGCLDPVRLSHHGWKKSLMGPVERWCLRRCARIVVTCTAEREWVWRYLGLDSENLRLKGPEVEIEDLKQFFQLIAAEKGKVNSEKGNSAEGKFLHLMFLGRAEDPLKGVRFLEQAVREVQSKSEVEGEQWKVELRIVSDHFGDELERDWEWCDVLCLPTLSENFGLVVAEALERGKRAIVTDGAPAWEEEERKMEKGKVKKCGMLTYVKGYRDGTDEERVRLLKATLIKKVSEKCGNCDENFATKISSRGVRM